MLPQPLTIAATQQPNVLKILSHVFADPSVRQPRRWALVLAHKNRCRLCSGGMRGKSTIHPVASTAPPSAILTTVSYFHVYWCLCDKVSVGRVNTNPDVYTILFLSSWFLLKNRFLHAESCLNRATANVILLDSAFHILNPFSPEKPEVCLSNKCLPQRLKRIQMYNSFLLYALVYYNTQLL